LFTVVLFIYLEVELTSPDLVC